ncbi:MAG: hypothetical protein ACK5LC_15520 [Coprobacillaceae bacterium]
MHTNKLIEIIIDNKEYFALEKLRFLEFYHFMQSIKHLDAVNNGTAKTVSMKDYIKDREKNRVKSSKYRDK